MEAQLQRSYGAHEEQPQHTGVHSEGEVEHHHEKKSVIKKVKEKAKKIKNSIKHLGHDQHHDHENDDDDEEYEDEEIENDPEVHGAPIYESTTIGTGHVPGQDIRMTDKFVKNLEDPRLGREGRLNSNARTEGREAVMETDDVPVEPAYNGHHGGLGRTERGPIHESSAMRSDVVPHQDIGMAPKSVGNFEHPSSRTEDRFDSRPTNEDNMSRFLHLVGEGRQSDDIQAEHRGLERTEREPGSKFGVLTGSPAEHGGLERTERESGARFGVQEGLEQDPQSPIDKPNPSNYQTKVTDPTGQRGKETGMAPIVASFGKMTVEDEASPNSIGTEGQVKSFGKMIVEDETNPSSIGEAPEQKTSYTGSHDQFSPEPIPTSTHFSPESTPKQFDSTKPVEEMPRDTIDGKSPGVQGTTSYTDKISSAASVIVGKAATAKNVVASKLGYGGGIEEGTHTKSPTEYAHKAVAVVTETLAPIYGRAAGVGSAVVSKVPGIGTGTGEEGEEGINESTMKETKGRGVGMKEFLAEKLRPGEEDKALSDVISESLHLQKEKTTEKPEAGGGETGGRTAIERVTESEEVARRLGSGQENPREGRDAFVAGSESSGNTVVDKIKDAVTSWVTKGGESPTSHQGSQADPSVNLEGTKNGSPGN